MHMYVQNLVNKQWRQQWKLKTRKSTLVIETCVELEWPLLGSYSIPKRKHLYAYAYAQAKNHEIFLLLLSYNTCSNIQYVEFRLWERENKQILLRLFFVAAHSRMDYGYLLICCVWHRRIFLIENSRYSSHSLDILEYSQCLQHSQYLLTFWNIFVHSTDSYSFQWF